MVGELLRRAHEAEVRAELAKRRISREAEAEVQAIRAGLREDLGEITARRIDRVAALTRDGDELLEVYRLRARGYGL